MNKEQLEIALSQIREQDVANNWSADYPEYPLGSGSYRKAYLAYILVKGLIADIGEDKTLAHFNAKLRYRDEEALRDDLVYLAKKYNKELKEDTEEHYDKTDLLQIHHNRLIDFFNDHQQQSFDAWSSIFSPAELPYSEEEPYFDGFPIGWHTAWLEHLYDVKLINLEYS